LLGAVASSALARNVYVANANSDDASVIETATNQVVGAPIPVVNGEQGSMAVAITPDGRRAYVANYDASGAVSVIDTATNRVIGAPIAVGPYPSAVAITPDGERAYVADGGGATVIDTAANRVVAQVPMVDGAFAIAITPDGKRAYAADYNQNNVSVIDTATNQLIGAPITVGSGPVAVAITPDGKRAYTANYYVNGTVSAIDTATDKMIGGPIAVGRDPASIAITPDGSWAYVANSADGNVSVIDTATDQVIGAPIAVGNGPVAVAITPDGSRAYVANSADENVSVIDTATNQVIGAPIAVGTQPHALAIVPDQPPVASFAHPSFVRPDVPAVFNAAASADPDGSIARSAWAFGDGSTAISGGPIQSHTYVDPGSYRETLALTDNEGCSTGLIFTGQTAYCNGSAVARQTQALEVAFPALRVRCPNRARGRGCKFELRAVTKSHKGRPETAVARARVKRGKAAIISLRPKPAFAAKLASAAKILVRESVTINGSKRTVIRSLRVVR
jgi:YVTN family beta-propeller protein